MLLALALLLGGGAELVASRSIATPTTIDLSSGDFADERGSVPIASCGETSWRHECLLEEAEEGEPDEKPGAAGAVLWIAAPRSATGRRPPFDREHGFVARLICGHPSRAPPR